MFQNSTMTINCSHNTQCYLFAIDVPITKTHTERIGTKRTAIAKFDIMFVVHLDIIVNMSVRLLREK